MSMIGNQDLRAYPLLDALTKRRSRRFGLGMKMASGPLAFHSRKAALPLTEEEEALMAFAAAGVTGHALLDLSFAPGQGGAIVARSSGGHASGDAIQTVSSWSSMTRPPIYSKGRRTFARRDLLDRRRATEQLSRALSAQSDSRSKNRPDGRRLAPFFNVNVNQWSLYAPGHELIFCRSTS